MNPLRIGCWSFTASDDLKANAATVRRGIAAASRAGVRALLTPECGLIGYPGAARRDLAGLDWCLVGDTEDDLLTEAHRQGIVLVLGSAGPVGGATLAGYANEAVTREARYRKRRLTPGDTSHFIAGQTPTLIDIDGWRCGLAICYDLRFSGVWRDLAGAGADAFLVIAHMAGPDPDPGVKPEVVPQFCAVRASEWATPLAFCNTTASDRWLDSGCWDARGVRTHQADAGAEGLLVADLQPRTAVGPWYRQIRTTALEQP